jgi:hypothetical protein
MVFEKICLYCGGFGFIIILICAKCLNSEVDLPVTRYVIFTSSSGLPDNNLLFQLHFTFIADLFIPYPLLA